jgi:REP element-mobilizing transposase RayT
MFLQPYQVEELRFASCFRVYYRWQTHRLRHLPALSTLNRDALDALHRPYNLHVLQASAGETDVRVLVSLLPSETVATGGGKMKGRVSKWLREQLTLPQAAKLLSRGYFACTTGKSTAAAVNAYLEGQGEHHGYALRPHPPVFVAHYPLTPADEERLRANHAATLLRFHVVLSTQGRKGVFGRPAAEATAARWRQLQRQYAMHIEKVSFVPDHMHVAVRLHPALSPASIIVALMNVAQELLWREL